MAEGQPGSTTTEAPDPGRDQAELIGRIIQSEQKLSDYFTTIITKSVTDQLDRRQMIRLRIVGVVVVSLLTVAIPGTMSWVRGTIVEQTETAMNVQFEQATSDIEARFLSFLEKERDYSGFTNYLIYLSDRIAIRPSELTEVRVRLEQMANDESVRVRPGFPRVLDLVARLAVRHGDRATLDLLEAEFGDRLTKSRTEPLLARFYGERVLGDVFTSEAKRAAAARRFQQHVDASEGTADFETLLPLQAMVDKQVGVDGSDGSFEGIRLHVKSLGPLDQASFIAESVRYSNPEFWEAATTSRSRRIARAAGQLVIDHRAYYIDLLDSVAVQTALIDLAELEANRGNASFSTALSGFRNAFSGELASTDDAEFRAAIDGLVHNDIALWMDDDLVIDAIRRQNRQTSAYSRNRIEELEAQWHDEFESGAYDLIEEQLERPISRLLRRVKRNSEGTYRELFVMDGVGLLVGSSDPNNDYWQGEEEKWLATFKVGPDAMHVGTLKFDESALAWVIQISLPIVDPGTGEPIGALTVGVNPSMLESL